MTNSSQTPFLEKYTDNLSAKIAQKETDYQVYGRDKEVAAVITSLRRRTKNNPVLVGEAGVGKTAIVEGLTLAILKGGVPEDLQGLTVRSLELSSLMTGEDGGFIAKFKKIIEEMVATRGKNLLFIDEFHTIVGAGSQEGQALDAGNIIKPVLARGDIQLIGATTLDEFHDYVETDRALERRMQPIMVDEPSQPQAIRMIDQAKRIYEDYHHIAISHEAVKQAVSLSVRYITDRFLPDKAFDLIDEAATIASAEKKVIVTEYEIAQVLKNRTGIPITTILKADKDRLEDLTEKLKRRVKDKMRRFQPLWMPLLLLKQGCRMKISRFRLSSFWGQQVLGKRNCQKRLRKRSLMMKRP